MPTFTPCRSAVMALGLLPLLFSGAAEAAEPGQTVAAMLADAPKPSDAPDADLAVESAKLSAALQKQYAGKPLTLEAGVLIQIITEGGGVKFVSFPTSVTKDGVGRSLCHATLKPDQEAEGKKLSPGDSSTLSGTVVSVSAKVDRDDAGKPVTHVFVTMEDASIVQATKAPRAKKKPAAPVTTEPMTPVG